MDEKYFITCDTYRITSIQDLFKTFSDMVKFYLNVKTKDMI